MLRPDIEMIPIENLRPAKYNPRKKLKPGDSIYEKLKKSIDEFGLVEPLVVNKNMTVIGGHQRLEVMRQRGDAAIPCIIVELDEKREKALNIALNKIHGLWDMPALKDLIAEIDDGSIDVELTGFDIDELEKILTDEKEFNEAEYLAEKIIDALAEKIKALAANHPAALNNAIAVVINNGRGHAIFVLADPNTSDIAQELKRYADAGESSPLECLMRARL